MRRVLVPVAKVAISAGLIWFLMSRLSLDEITAAMNAPRWGWLAAALAVYGLSAFGGALQWSWILRTAGVAAPVREVRRLYFIGLFFNNFLPANIGGDAWKIVDLGRQEGRPLAVFCATLLDRLLGLTALTLLAVAVLAGAVLGGVPLPQSALLLLPVFVVLAAALAALLSRRVGGKLPDLVAAAGSLGAAARLRRVTDEFTLYRPRVRWLNLLLAFSTGVQFLRIATHLLVARGLGFDLAAEQAVQLFVLIPMLAISLTLPVTINGIGLRESISANLLVWAGLAAPQAVAMEVAAYLVQVVFSLQGGVLLWA
ncbi:MAG: flippase-like domain-containing protein, partial [Krumholzibacteria bacterium]|nr:flippase-like domain-containing protein [Candidatus Krumholzibacteria bacterium]